MRRARIAVVSVAWGVAIGGTFGWLLPYLLGYWHFHQPLPGWVVARVAGAMLIGAGLLAIVASFAEFARAHGTPAPLAPPTHLVVCGLYRYVRNPIYVGFLAVLIGQALLFGSRGLVEYAAVSWCVAAAGVRFYEEPALVHRFGVEYEAYRRAVRAWIPRLRPWTPGSSRALRRTETGHPRRTGSTPG